MPIEQETVDVDAIMRSLKLFQRRTVDFVFDRLYGADATRRFLVADEVGLGKTHVARGLIARAIAHLRERGVERIDIVYICSNSDIARQNINRLNVTGRKDFPFTTRITMLPSEFKEIAKQELNFISFTPGTSFTLGHQTGQARERALLYWLLRRAWPRLSQGVGPLNLLQCWSSRESFQRSIDDADPSSWVNSGLARAFQQRLRREDRERRARGETTYRTEYRDLCSRFARRRKQVPDGDATDRNRFIGEMRSLLAATCIEALEPDLIILDEFQRFKDLLDPDNEAGALASHLFDTNEARVLLLSATPYKMYTLSHEREIDDHYKDFLSTLRFLYHDERRTRDAQELLRRYGQACAMVHRDGTEPVRALTRQIEAHLGLVMCRTERLAVTADRSGMLHDQNDGALALRPAHIESYVQLRNVADLLDANDPLEYWKASPFLFNFMEKDHYRIKARMIEQAGDDGGRGSIETDRGNGAPSRTSTTASPLAACLARSRGIMLDRARWAEYADVDPNHPQLERLAGRTVDDGWWRLLWVPPACPYYRLEGVYAEPGVRDMTKQLVFSSWHVVPRSISVLLSYKAERQMMRLGDVDAQNTDRHHEKFSQRLAFARSSGRLTGMPVLGILYPSFTLAALGDPRSVPEALTPHTNPPIAPADLRMPSLAAVLDTVRARIGALLQPLVADRLEVGGNEDESWYWAAPLLLDRAADAASTELWFADATALAAAWSGEEDGSQRWVDHVEAARSVATGFERPSGRPPADLADMLALLAVAGPAVCSLRAITGCLHIPATLLRDPAVRHAAGRMGWALRSLFNSPEVTALVRGLDEREPYWRRVLEYGANGCLQSVLDEYLHLLAEPLESRSLSPAEFAAELADSVTAAASMRAATPGIDWVEVHDEGRVKIDPQRVRARFAMRFGDERGEREESSLRKDAVRRAFNSPFWPFVVATTSIGQEGLDFHSYCHSVIHWNLPSNPVDLEQREGRVHRYKGHAVRKNVARHARVIGAEADLRGPHNPWPLLFNIAARASSANITDADIKPYWVFPIDGGAVIERHAPNLPLSQEAARLPALRASLAIYRMVFGQPRQQDLLEHLRQSVPEAARAEIAEAIMINLEPRAVEID